MTTLRANPYSGEHRVRADVLAALTEHDYVIDRYSIVDKGADRVVTIVASKNLEATQTNLKFNTDPDKHPDEI